jgi:hypothetical protein
LFGVLHLQKTVYRQIDEENSSKSKKNVFYW